MAPIQLHQPDGSARSHRRRASSVSGYALEATLRTTGEGTSKQRRRRSTLINAESNDGHNSTTTSTVDDEPSNLHNDYSMSLSRSPSPQDDGGWATAGLSSAYRKTTKSHQREDESGAGVTWASAQVRRDKVNRMARKGAGAGTEGMGFIRRHMRNISNSLPVFYQGIDGDRLATKGKRKDWSHPRLGASGSYANRLARLVWRLRLRLAVFFALILMFILFRASRKYYAGCLRLAPD